MSLDIGGLGTFMCNKDLHSPWNSDNVEIDWSKRGRKWKAGVFFFTETGWKRVGYPMTHKLNAERVSYKVLEGYIPDQRSVLYKDRLQIVIQRSKVNFK